MKEATPPGLAHHMSHARQPLCVRQHVTCSGVAERTDIAGEGGAPRQLLTSLDDLLDEVDGLLSEEDPEEFVRSYVQRAGNGGGQFVALLQTWVQALGPERVRDFLRLLHFTEDKESYVRDGAWTLLSLRYGERAAGYLSAAVDLAPDLTGWMRDLLFHHGLDIDIPDRGLVGWTPFDAEVRLRMAERGRDFLEVHRLLRIALQTLSPDDGAGLAEEYHHLVDASENELSDLSSELVRLLDLHRAIKIAIAPRAEDLADDGSERVVEDVADLDEIEPRTGAASQSAVGRAASVEVSPARKGASLEIATVALLRRVFELSAAEGEAIATELRRQAGGYQFGHDVELVVRSARSKSVRCHLECKSYSRPIRTRDIADKLLQQKSASRHAPIDHWILISPHSDPANDLAEMLHEWEHGDDWPFRVQIWSPRNGVRQLFAVVPEVYRALFADEPPPLDEGQVINEVRDRLAPQRRLHPGLREYLTEPWRMCFRGEDAGHFASIEADHVQLRTVDLAGRPMGGTLADVVDRWLVQAEAPTMLLLGEFGDGKSFFTYMLARRLAGDFLTSSGGVLPVRLQLRELRELGSVDTLIDRWLDDIGVPQSEWRRLAANHRSLVILDGFDEMTKELDAATIDANLRLLTETIETVTGPSTYRNTESKVLVTSRGRFFDNPREEAALKDRLQGPTVVRIRPVRRTEVLEHLSRYARSIGADEKLARIRLLYDPIGLASKPLFLQMIKSTLEKLPEDNFGASTLYEKYIEESLRNKANLLFDDQPQRLTAEMVDRMSSILERVAVRMHSSGDLEVNLRDVEGVDGDLAEMLWRMASINTSTSVARTADARARVSIRSLLHPMPSSDPDDWHVSFFHTSMMEYFLAAAIARALAGRDIEAIHEMLGPNQLSIETIAFAAERLRSSPDHQPLAARLASIAHTARVDTPSPPMLGGNAMTLHYELSGAVEGDDWSNLRLDHVSLRNADLRGINFSGSSLRFANLDNADLRQANLSHADLTGFRIEQTTLVRALVVDPDTRAVVAAYSDGAIREWRQTGPRSWSAERVYDGIPQAIRQILLISDSLALVTTSTDAWIFARTTPQWTRSTRMAVSPFLRHVAVPQPGILTSLQVSPEAERYAVELLNGTATRRPLADPSGLGTVARFDLDEDQPTLLADEWMHYRSFRSGRLALLHFPTNRSWYLDDFKAITSVDVRRFGDNTLVAVGSEDGVLRIGSLPSDETEPNVTLRSVDGSRHDGPITAVQFVSPDLVVTGGADRCIRVCELETNLVTALYLEPQCTGAAFDGVKGPDERQILQRLAQGSEIPDPDETIQRKTQAVLDATDPIEKLKALAELERAANLRRGPLWPKY